MHIPFDLLPADTLRNLVEHFVTREGTDYGEVEVELEDKIAQVIAQLRRSEALIVFDEESESCSIVKNDQR